MGVKITDTTLRDAHQSLLATRMRTRPVILSGHHALVPRTASSRRNLGRGSRILSTGQKRT